MAGASTVLPLHAHQPHRSACWHRHPQDGKAAKHLMSRRAGGRPANRSTPARASSLTRVRIAPTVRQATRSAWATVDLQVRTVNQATVSSKASVCLASCLAQGTEATTTPCSRHLTRGASASTNVLTVPRSSARPRRRCPAS